MAAFKPFPQARGNRRQVEVPSGGGEGYFIITGVLYWGGGELEVPSGGEYSIFSVVFYLGAVRGEFCVL